VEETVRGDAAVGELVERAVLGTIPSIILLLPKELLVPILLLVTLLLLALFKLLGGMCLDL
jgi:hypothetical protein